MRLLHQESISKILFQSLFPILASRRRLLPIPCFINQKSQYYKSFSDM